MHDVVIVGIVSKKVYSILDNMVCVDTRNCFMIAHFTDKTVDISYT